MKSNSSVHFINYGINEGRICNKKINIKVEEFNIVNISDITENNSKEKNREYLINNLKYIRKFKIEKDIDINANFGTINRI